MRISSKLTVGLSLASLAVLSAHGIWQVTSERRDLDTAVEHEVRLIGRSLQVGLENALRNGRAEDITRIMEKVDTVDPNLDILVLDTAEHVQAASPGRRQQTLDLALDPSTQEDGYRLHGEADRQVATFTHQLKGEDGKSLGRILIIRPLDDLHRDLARTERLATAVLFALVMLVAAVQYALGRRYVTRPLERLAAAMQRVRMGNLSQEIVMPRDDEAGMLAAEFNSMLQELRLARQQLAEEAEARQRSQQHLQDVNKLATLGQLSAGLAHEIGSPLQIINGRARTLLTGPLEEPVVRRTAQILVDQSDRITRIVENLLRFARGTPAQRTSTNLAAAARQVMEFMEVEAKRCQVSLKLEAEDGLPNALADVDQVQQVVLNLINNALHASPKGGTVVVALQAVEGRRPGQDGVFPAVRLSVRDDGTGIPDDVKERLFEPFFTTRAKQGGTGLGLPVVKSIANDHSATVLVETKVGAGTSVSVDFPRADALQEAA